MIFIITNDKQKLIKAEKIYYEYRAYMWVIAYKILGRKDLSEDAVHDAFLRAFKNLHKIDENNKSKTKSYLGIIVKHTAIDIYNKQKNIILTDDEIDNVIPREDKNIPLDIVVSQDNIRMLADAIKKLKPIYQVVIFLKYTHDLTNEEIAKTLEISVDTVKKRIMRARKILSKIFKEEGIYDEYQ